MNKLWLLFFFLFMVQHCQCLTLKHCSDNVTLTQLCRLGDEYRTPVEFLSQLPIHVHPSMDIYDVTDVSVDDHSVTIHAEFKVLWNDSSISFVQPKNE